MELEQEVTDFISRCENRNIPSETTATLKLLRDEGRALENLVSFCRRVIQTRLDLVAEAGDPMDSTLQSPTMSENPSLASRFVTVELSDEEVARAEEYVHSLVGDDRSMSLEMLNPQDRADYRRTLEVGERTVSKTRQRLHVVMGELADELVRRYRDGLALEDASPQSGS